jgi:hypothetical protein
MGTRRERVVADREPPRPVGGVAIRPVAAPDLTTGGDGEEAPRPFDVKTRLDRRHWCTRWKETVADREPRRPAGGVAVGPEGAPHPSVVADDEERARPLVAPRLDGRETGSDRKSVSPMGNHGDQLAVLPPGQNELHTRPSWPMTKSEHAPSRLRVLIAVTGAPGGNVLSPSANHPDQSDVPSRGQ